MSINQNKKLYSITEAMHVLNLGRTSVYKAVNEGKLIIKKFGKRSFVPEESIRNFIENLPELKVRES